MNRDDLLELKKKIEKNQTERTLLEGRIKERTKELKEKFDCDSLEDAKTLAVSYDEDIKKLKKKLNKKLTKIESLIQ